MLLFEALRNISRRKVRSGLTIFGIIIGVFAITVMGSLSEYLNQQIDGAIRIAGSTIGVRQDRDDPTRRITTSTVNRLNRVDGVQTVIRTLQDPLDAISISFGPPLTVFGIAPENVRHFLRGVGLAEGRWLERGDAYQAVIGSKVATAKKVSLGGTLEWRKKQYTVVGLLENTEAFPDQGVIISFDTVRKEMRLPESVVGRVSVVPVSDDVAETVVERINEQVPGVVAQSPERQIAEIRQGMLILNAIMLSGAVIAGIVGGLSVVNTMVMAVRERTREIGLKKAIGASDTAIVGEYLTEATAMGIVGGIAGIILGIAMAEALNAVFYEQLSGAPLFTVTPRLLTIAMGFAIGLGGLDGLYPAWAAARLDPVEALRTE
jgi:putative ABC transport system permease protein